MGQRSSLSARFVGNKRGVVLVFTFIIVVSIIVFVVAFLSVMAIRTKSAGYDIMSHQAFWIAEAGMQDVFFQIIDDASYRSNPTQVSGTLGNGNYVVGVSRFQDVYTMTSSGTVDVITRQITMSVEVTVSDAFDNAIYAGGNIQTTGATNLSITGTQVSMATEFPSVDFSFYQTAAPAGQDISGNHTFTAGTYSGIWHIDGSVTIDSGVTINGSIVATGAVTSTNEANITINPTSNNPALISNDRINFFETDNITIDGLIYSGADGSGEFNLSRADTVDITGVIISGGATNLSQSTDATITYDGSIAADPPGGLATTNFVFQNDWDEI